MRRFHYVNRIDSRYADGFDDVAKRAWDLIKVPLKAMGDAGLRILSMVSQVVKFLIFLRSTHAVYDYFMAREKLKRFSEQLGVSEEYLNKSAGDYIKKKRIQLGLSLLKGAVAMALSLIADKIIASAKHAIR